MPIGDFFKGIRDLANRNIETILGKSTNILGHTVGIGGGMLPGKAGEIGSILGPILGHTIVPGGTDQLKHFIGYHRWNMFDPLEILKRKKRYGLESALRELNMDLSGESFKNFGKSLWNYLKPTRLTKEYKELYDAKLLNKFTHAMQFRPLPEVFMESLMRPATYKNIGIDLIANSLLRNKIK